MPDRRTNGHPIDGSEVVRRSTPDRPSPDRTTDHATSERMTHHQRTRAQERVDEIDVSPTKLLADLERLRGEVETARRESDEYKALLQRERAEFLNYKRRTTEEREQMLGLAAESLIGKVLAVADDFDRAIDNRPAELEGNAWAEGIAAIDRKLRLLLESEGVRPIEAPIGRPFDPREHEAIATVPGTGQAEGQIVEEIRRGYRLRDRVLRPALVAVAGPRESSDGGVAPPPGSDRVNEPTTEPTTEHGTD
jgi:molecular chaperone GrpE